MNKEGLEQCGCWFDDTGKCITDDIDLNEFAKLVAEREREACAKDCESMNSVEDYYGERIELFCAEAIRARGQE